MNEVHNERGEEQVRETSERGQARLAYGKSGCKLPAVRKRRQLRLCVSVLWNGRGASKVIIIIVWPKMLWLRAAFPKAKEFADQRLAVK